MWENLQDDLAELFSDYQEDTLIVEARFCADRRERQNEARRFRRWVQGAKNQALLPQPCAECAEPFQPRIGGQAQIYCSASCRRRAADRRLSDQAYEHRLTYIQSWRSEHPEKVRAYQQSYRSRLSAEAKQRELDQARSRKHARRAESVGVIVCRGCGCRLDWHPGKLGRLPVWCSDRCRKRKQTL